MALAFSLLKMKVSFPSSSLTIQTRFIRNFPFYEALVYFRNLLDHPYSRWDLIEGFKTEEGWKTQIEPHIIRGRTLQRPLHYTYNALLRALCDDHLIHESFVVFKKMADMGVLQTSFTYNTLMRGMSRSNYKVEYVFAHMIKKSVKPDVVTCNTLMEAYLSKFKIMEAERVMHGMIKLKIFPTYITYTSLIRAHACVGRLDVASLYLLKLTRNGGGTLPDLRAYNAIIHGCCYSGRLTEAYEYFDKLEKDGLVANLTTYNLLADGCVKKGYVDEAVKVLKVIEKKGFGPDKFTMQVLRNMVTWYGVHFWF